jgi:hypothetical protein
MSDPTGGAGPIIIRRAADSASLKPKEQSFLIAVAVTLEGGKQPTARDRERCKRLLGKVCFG